MLDLARYNLEQTWPKLAELQKEVAHLEREKERAERAVRAACQGVQSAKEQDAIAGDRAVRAGKDMPSATNEAKATAALEDAERTLAAYTKAAQAAQADISEFQAKHRAELSAAIQAAVGEKACTLAEHARQAAALYGQIEDARHDLRAFEPPQVAEDFTGPPAHLTTSVIGTVQGRNSGRPDRGVVQGMLEYLASLETQYAPAEDGESDAA